MGDDAFAKPSALPGWTRAHVLTHVARNADAMINLLTWARTGVPTPAYASREQRDADIEAGAGRTPAEIRADLIASSDRLAAAVRAMPEEAWSARIADTRGRRMVASDMLWLRAREMWIHAIDLDVGASFADLPRPMLRELLTDAAATLGARPDFPRLLLVPSDESRTWTVGEGPRIGRGTAGGPRDRCGARRLAARPVEGPRAAHGRGEAPADAAAMALTSTNGAHPGSGAYPDFAAVRAEFGLPDGFPPAVLAEAAAAAAARPAPGPHRVDATDVELVTIDPPGSKDLDQALGVVRRGRRLPRALRHRRPRRRGRAGRGAGHRGAPPRADGLPARRVGAAAPAGAVRGRGEPAPGRPAGRRAVAHRPRRRRRAGVRRRAPGDGPVPGPARLRGRAGRPRRRAGSTRRSPPCPRSARCAARWRCAAGRSSWSCPSRRSCARAEPAGGWTVQVRQRIAVEDWNAEISLLTGMAAARIMLDAGVGVLRTLPAADPDAVDALREVARGLGIDWPAGATPAELLSGLPRGTPAALALRRAATTLLRGAGYTAFDTARRGPAAGRCRTRRDRGAVRARHGAAAAAGRPVRHRAVPGRHGRRGGARVAARGPAHPARGDGRLGRGGQCGLAGLRRPDRGGAAGRPRRNPLRRGGAAGLDRLRAGGGVPARSARAGPLQPGRCSWGRRRGCGSWRPTRRRDGSPSPHSRVRRVKRS